MVGGCMGCLFRNDPSNFIKKLSTTHEHRYSAGALDTRGYEPLHIPAIYEHYPTHTIACRFHTRSRTRI